ncbi:MAG: hypothetical protein ACREML_09025 [Vulcanimicrobiaceae bacterium]
MEPNDFAFAGTRALEAREHLTSLAQQHGDEHHMAEIGKTALFEEALLTALRAHLNELKIVAR